MAKQKKTKKAKGRPKKVESKKYNRMDASALYLKNLTKKVTVEKGIAGADALYVKAGGVSNLKEAAYSFHKAVKVFIVLGLLTVEKGVITRVQ